MNKNWRITALEWDWGLCNYNCTSSQLHAHYPSIAYNWNRTIRIEYRNSVAGFMKLFTDYSDCNWWWKLSQIDLPNANIEDSPNLGLPNSRWNWFARITSIFISVLVGVLVVGRSSIVFYFCRTGTHSIYLDIRTNWLGLLLGFSTSAGCASYDMRISSSSRRWYLQHSNNFSSLNYIWALDWFLLCNSNFFFAGID